MDKPLVNPGRRARRIRTSYMLSAEEERRLVRAWQDGGDRPARDRLLRAFAPLAASVAKRFQPRSVEADPDLVQQANIGLMKAADRFDLAREIRFSTYAVWWVRAEVQAYARANMSVVRRPNSAKARAAVARITALHAAMAADPDMDRGDAAARLADALGVDVQKAADLHAQVTGADHSLDVPALEDGGEERISLLVDPASLDEPAPLQRLETAALRRALVDALSALPGRERDIIVATQIMDPPVTLEGLGGRYGVSKERVRQLRERGFERLRAAFARRGLTPDSFI